MTRPVLTILIAIALAACGGEEIWDMEENAMNPGMDPMVEVDMPPDLNLMQRAEAHLNHMPQRAEIPDRLPPDWVAPSDDLDPPIKLEDDCSSTLCCKLWGWCTGDKRTGKCVVGSNEDCQASTFCADLGNCTRTQTEIGWSCRPGSDEDCRQAHVCRAFNQCTWNKEDLACE